MLLINFSLIKYNSIVLLTCTIRAHNNNINIEIIKAQHVLNNVNILI